MHDPTTHFISQMKLRELRDHRAKLDASYDRIEAGLVDGEPDAEALVSLYRELEGMRVAGRRLHPELEHLGHVFDVFSRRAPDPGLLEAWYARVRHSLTRGRDRARWVEIFGQALADLAAAKPRVEDPPTQDLLAKYLRGGLDASSYRDTLFEAVETIAPETLKWMRSVWGEGECPVRSRVEAHEITEILERICGDHCRPGELRAQARTFVSDDALTRELTDAMSLQLERLDEWSWPAEVEAQATRMRHRWRLQLCEDLPTACLFELLGDRIGAHFLGTLDGGRKLMRKSRLERLRSLDAPAIIIENEERMLAELSHQDVSHDAFVWEDALGVEVEEELRDPGGFRGYGTVLQHRRDFREGLSRVTVSDGYGRGGGDHSIDAVLGWVHAEVALARAVEPAQPLWVVKLDVKDFFPSLHHGPLLDMLTLLGLPDDLRDVFSRMLRVPMVGGAAWSRGVPVARGLSRALSELFMHLFERVVRSKASVRIIRLVDDVCFMSPSREHAEEAWSAALTFLDAFDLLPNVHKCGTLGLNTDETSGALPIGEPGWGIWRMAADASGELEWMLDDDHFDMLVRHARDRVHYEPALIDAVRAYNEVLGLFTSTLAIRRPLDASHRSAIGQALTRFERGVLGEAGALEWCRARLAPDARDALTEVLLHWPITAGGLGLAHAHVDVARFERQWQGRQIVPAPEKRATSWEVRETDWGRFFAQWSNELADVRVDASPRMEALIADFIQRGSEVGGRHQSNLSSYWRTIVQMYGPDLLERFGTFRFLLTELVPLRLITHGDADLDDPGSATSSSRSDGFGDEDIPF